MARPLPPTGVWLSALFFALAGALEVVLALVDGPHPLGFWPLWEALGRGLLHGLVAWGLWERIALCRTIAMVYCLAALVTYVIAVALAVGGAPLQFPPSVVVQSLFQVPSCAVLLRYLRSPRAAEVFPRPLLPR
ncbi:MAG TPA: hypothetical protein VFO85_13485 [Vicinamibacteria bacterium]|nr:hypothetical protein [Vicinamibacteria bacterium]